MGYWADKPASRKNLRLFKASGHWVRFEDELQEVDGRREVVQHGSARELETGLLNALNATHLNFLTGAGSSFCVQNSRSVAKRDRGAPGLRSLWNAVKERVGETQFGKVLNILPFGDRLSEFEIEELLTRSKLYIELFGRAGSDGKEIYEFIQDAEAAILEAVDFVDVDSTLVTHQAVLRKMARRGERKARARLFTTNYDRAFEVAAHKQRFSIIDGFSYSTPAIYDRSNFELDVVRRSDTREYSDFIDSVFHLYKLHGSVDWRRIKGDLVRTDSTEGEPVLI